MTKIVTPALPKRRYYRLADAARILDCSENDLLHWGAHYEINIGVLMAEIVSGPETIERKAALTGDWEDGLVFDNGTGRHYRYANDNGSLICNKEKNRAYVEGLWFLTVSDLQDIELKGHLLVAEYSENGNWGPFWGTLRLHNGNYSQCVSVAMPFRWSEISTEHLYIASQDMERLLTPGSTGEATLPADKGKSKPFTNEDRWFDVLGVMAVLLYENTSDPRMRKGDNNINMSGIKGAVIDKAQKLGLSGERLENLNKDISAALKILQYLPPKN